MDVTEEKRRRSMRRWRERGRRKSKAAATQNDGTR